MEKNKISLVYATKTGHSKKIANAIAGELNIQAENLKNNPILNNVDLLVIIGGIYGGQSLPELIKFAESLDNSKVKKVALITSSMSKSTPQTAVRSALQGKGIEVIEEEFMCQGSFLFLGWGHPKKEELSDAIAFVRKLSN